MRARRKAFTLIELMLVVSVGAIVMGISAAWIHQSLSTASVMRERSRHHQSLLRLSRSLRDLVQSGQTISMDGEDVLIIETEGKNPSSFTITPGAIRLRSESDRGVAEDTFQISDHALAKWDTSELPDRITLVVYRRPPTPRLTEIPESVDTKEFPVDLHVRVAPGRLQRLGIQWRQSE